MEKLISFLFPSKCVICGFVGDVVCAVCLRSARLVSRRYMLGINVSSVYCLFEYSGCVRDCVRYSKYAPKMFHALKFITSWGASCSSLPDYEGYIVVPIPLSKKRFAKRGFNQSEIIARELADMLGLMLLPTVLKRSKETSPQYTLGRADRIKNVEGAFTVREDVCGKNILLVDDICTSGSTLLSAEDALYKKGARSVELFSLSKKL